jgi:K+-sensing histidine kinase KdpD
MPRPSENPIRLAEFISSMGGSLINSRPRRYGLAVLGVLISTAAMYAAGSRVNSTTAALVFLILILSAATFFGRNPALAASLAAMLSLNYFFLPPVGTWHIADPQNLIAWAAFTVTAIIAGELSAYAQRRAHEANRLYRELQDAFGKAAEAEALKQSEKLKSALLEAVTHDLRTPLTSIKASVTTLLESEGGHRTIELKSDEKSEFLAIINEETDRLNGFIEGMVELARVEAGSVGGGALPAEVSEIISAAVRRAETVASGHDLTVDTEPNLPLIAADARAVAEVLYNLIENAVKYSPRGTEIGIAVRAHGNRVLISVNDQGRGVPAHLRERVFEKFVRGSNEQGGLGLGLAIARGIVDAQGGEIKLQDGEGGVGTKVVVALPVSGV